jgi:hypothetical protein
MEPIHTLRRQNARFVSCKGDGTYRAYCGSYRRLQLVYKFLHRFVSCCVCSVMFLNRFSRMIHVHVFRTVSHIASCSSGQWQIAMQTFQILYVIWRSFSHVTHDRISRTVSHIASCSSGQWQIAVQTFQILYVIWRSFSHVTHDRISRTVSHIASCSSCQWQIAVQTFKILYVIWRSFSHVTHDHISRTVSHIASCSSGQWQIAIQTFQTHLRNIYELTASECLSRLLRCECMRWLPRLGADYMSVSPPLMKTIIVIITELTPRHGFTQPKLIFLCR